MTDTATDEVEGTATLIRMILGEVFGQHEFGPGSPFFGGEEIATDARLVGGVAAGEQVVDKLVDRGWLQRTEEGAVIISEEVDGGRRPRRRRW